MKAIIMAGGKGTRLRPLTLNIPKPMVPILNVPNLEHIINLLKSHGIKEIGITLMYMPQKIKNYFGDGSDFGVHIEYFMESTPLGTAGSVKNAQHFLDDTFIVISGDCVTDINLTDIINFHKFKQALATLVLTHVDVPLDYGVVITDNSNYVTQFLEKPSWGEVFSDTVNTGIYVLEPQILEYIDKDIQADFSRDLFPKLLEKNKPLCGYATFDYWTDIGSFEAYMKTNYDILEQKINIPIFKYQRHDNIWIGKNTTISPSAIINGPCYIGSNCKIGNDVLIDKFTVIGDNCIIEDKVSIKRSIIWNNCSIGFASELHGCLLCDHVRINQYVSCFENSVIGNESVIHERAVIKPNIKIWAQKSVDPLSIVDRSVVWGTKYSTSLFGYKGLSGTLNVDITPEFASRLGSAYGSVIGSGKTVIVSSNTANPARMFKHAFIAGLLSVGTRVYNMSGMMTPLARQAVNLLDVAGGIHVKSCDGFPEKIQIDFMDSTGINASQLLEKNIQNAFYKEDFKRCMAEEIPDLNNITDFASYYTKHLLNITDCEAIKRYPLKICLASSSDDVLSLLAPLLEELGCTVTCQLITKGEYKEYIHRKALFAKASFSAFIDCNAEKIYLIDKNGRIIKDDLFLLFTSYILLRSIPGCEIVVPVNATSALEKLSKKYNGLIHRVKSTPNVLLREIMYTDVFADRINQYIIQYDAISSLVKIIEFIALNNTTLENILKFLPKFYLYDVSVHCPWNYIGKVMRIIITEESEKKVDLLDGIKIFLQDGWVLLLPDAENPLIHIYSEGASQKITLKYLSQYHYRVKEIVESIK